MFINTEFYILPSGYLAGKKFNRFVNVLDDYAEKITEKIHYKRLKVWKNLLFKPKETLQKEEKNSSLMRGAKDIAVVALSELGVFGLLLLLIVGFFMLIITAISSLASKGFNGSVLNLFLIFIAVVVAGVVAMALFSVMGWLVTAGLEFIAARLLGGVGTFRKHAYLTALERAAVMACYLPLLIFIMVPFVGALLYPISMLISFYGLYVQYLVIRQVHKLSKLKTIAVIVAPTVLIMAFTIAIILLVYLVIIVAALAKK